MYKQVLIQISAPPLRSLRLGGFGSSPANRRDAGNAELAQKRIIKLNRTYKLNSEDSYRADKQCEPALVNPKILARLLRHVPGSIRGSS